MFVDTTTSDAQHPQDSMQYATPYYGTDPQENAVNLSVPSATTANNERNDISDFLQSLVNKHGLAEAKKPSGSVTTPLSTDVHQETDGDVLSPLSINNDGNRAVQRTPRGTRTTDDKQSQLGIKNQVESKTVNNKLKNRKRHRSKTTASQPPCKKNKTTVVTSKRQLRSLYSSTLPTPRRSKNSSKRLFRLSLDDVLGFKTKCKAVPKNLKEEDPVKDHLTDEVFSDVPQKSDHESEYEEKEETNIKTEDGNLNVVHHRIRRKRKTTRSFPCPVCKANHKDVIFNSNSSLNKHMKEDHPTFRFQCVKCDKEYASYNACYKHIVRTHYLLRHKCETCGKGFPYPKELTFH